ncbi:unnamed protein product [Orchesella dallaii]|uniref:Uncharacterized protein n=1 Tax=Orchesella dallaii TaxID=48710 RepID=A0ABP1QLX0_9HEXA
MKAFLLQNKYFETSFFQRPLAGNGGWNGASAVFHCDADLQPVSGLYRSKDFVSGIRRALQDGRQLDSWEETVSVCINTKTNIQNMSYEDYERHPCPYGATQIQVHGPFLDDLLSKYKDLIKMRILLEFSSFVDTTQRNQTNVFPVTVNVESKEMKCSSDGNREDYSFEDELAVAWPLPIASGVHVYGTVTLELIACVDASSNEDLSTALQLLCLNK